MTHRTTPSTRRTRRSTAPLVGALALALLGTTGAAGSAAASPTSVTATTGTARTTAQTTDLGFITRIARTTKGTTLVLDRVELLTGAAAKAEQRRRGLDTTPDVFIRNDNPLLRSRAVAPGVAVLGSQQLAGRPTATPVPLDRLVRSVAARPKGTTGPLFRLTLDARGRVVRIAEVYLA